MATLWQVSPVSKLIILIIAVDSLSLCLLCSLFESSQSLFWASFGMIDLEDFELTGIKSYTRFWGLLMFGSYSVINVIVLLNLLIAMMSNSYAMIDVSAPSHTKQSTMTLDFDASACSNTRTPSGSSRAPSSG